MADAQRLSIERPGKDRLRMQGVDQIVPVDVYAPGCPPTPETLIHAIETLHQLIEDGEIMRRRESNNGGAGIQLTEGAVTAAPVTLGTK